MESDALCQDMTTVQPELVVRRPVYQQDELHRIGKYSQPNSPLNRHLLKKCQNFNIGSCMRKSLPITAWLYNYKWKRDLGGDIVAGVTVAVMHIPQGMAYAILGYVPPITGLYMAFFPALIYAIFGSSRHNSMGTFAVVCMMTGKVVSDHSTEFSESNSMNPSDKLDDYAENGYTSTEVATAVTLLVALMQLSMYILRLGVISSLLSETLVSGFTTGAAIHVLTSQVKDLFGLQLVKRKGLFKVILTYVDVINHIREVNVAAIIISLITIIVIIINNEFLKAKIARICPLPVPIEMIVVVLGSVLSTQLHLAENHGILVVGEIPVGLPAPKLPPITLLGAVSLDSFIITMVSYSISMSMAFIFAQKLNYEVNPNQELLAQGLGNLLGSFFSCMPFCASLSRSAVQETVGGKTQLATLVSCSLILGVLLWIGPFFQVLPKCILAGIIVVALKGMLLQIKDFSRFWKTSKFDAGIWISTLISVVVLDVEYGLLIGAILCIGNLMALSMRPYTCELALVPGTEFYLDLKRYKGTVEISGVKIVHYCGGLNFASRQYFKKNVYKIAGVIPQKELALRSKNLGETSVTDRMDVVEVCRDIVRDLAIAREWKKQDDDCGSEGYSNPAFKEDIVNYQYQDADSFSSSTYNKSKFKVLIIDFSALIHIDPAGVTALRSLVEEYKQIDVSVYITGCSGPVFDTIQRCNLVERREFMFTIFPTVNDAVTYAQQKGEISPVRMSSNIEKYSNQISMSWL